MRTSVGEETCVLLAASSVRAGLIHAATLDGLRTTPASSDTWRGFVRASATASRSAIDHQDLHRPIPGTTRSSPAYRPHHRESGRSSRRGGRRRALVGLLPSSALLSRTSVVTLCPAGDARRDASTVVMEQRDFAVLTPAEAFGWGPSAHAGGNRVPASSGAGVGGEMGLPAP